MSSTAQVQQGQQAPPVHPPGEHSLAQLVRDNTNQGEMIVHFLIDAMRGRIDGAKTSHRIDAARLLLKLGSDDAPAFIADFSSHTRPGGGSAYSSGAIVGRHNRKYVTRLAKFARSQTGNGKDLVNFLVDAMLGRPEDFKPAARLAAARELLRLGWETVPTVGRNRKARRSEAAANGLLVDSRKAAPNGPKANGAKTNGRKAAHNGAKTNGRKAAHNGARTSGRKTASNGAKAGGRKTASNGAKAGGRKIRQPQPTAARAAAHNGAKTNGRKAAHNGARTSGRKTASNGAKAGGRKTASNGAKAGGRKIRQPQPTAARAAAHNGAVADDTARLHEQSGEQAEPPTDRDDDSRQSNNPQHDDEEAPWYDRPTPPVTTVVEYDAGRNAQQDAEPEQPPRDPDPEPSYYERQAMRKGIDLWRDPTEYWIAADPTAYRPSQRIDSTYFPRGP